MDNGKPLLKWDELGENPVFSETLHMFQVFKIDKFHTFTSLRADQIGSSPQKLGRKSNMFKTPSFIHLESRWRTSHLWAIAIYFHYDVKLIFRSNSPIRRCFDRKRFPHQMSPRYPKVPALWNDLPESPQKIQGPLVSDHFSGLQV